MLKRLFLEHFPVQELFSDTLNTTWTNPCFLKWWAVLLLGVNLVVVCLPLRILLIRRSVFLLKDSFSLSNSFNLEFIFFMKYSSVVKRWFTAFLKIHFDEGSCIVGIDFLSSVLRLLYFAFNSFLFFKLVLRDLCCWFIESLMLLAFLL